MDSLKVLNSIKENIDRKILIHENELKKMDKNSNEYHFIKGEINGLAECKSLIELVILLF